jgi:hypothetical protein
MGRIRKIGHVYDVPMRIAVVTIAIALLCAWALSEGGQGPVDPGPIVIDDLRLGEYWYAKDITKEDLAGKVVLVEIWGS